MFHSYVFAVFIKLKKCHTTSDKEFDRSLKCLINTIYFAFAYYIKLKYIEQQRKLNNKKRSMTIRTSFYEKHTSSFPIR